MQRRDSLDETANREYIRQFVLEVDSEGQRGVPSDREVGRPYGFEWAEAHHYIGPRPSRLEDYITRNAVPI